MIHLQGHYKYVIVLAGSGVLPLSGRIANLLAHSGMSMREIIVINVIVSLLFYIFNNDLKESSFFYKIIGMFNSSIRWTYEKKKSTCSSERISELIEPFVEEKYCITLNCSKQVHCQTRSLELLSHIRGVAKLKSTFVAMVIELNVGLDEAYIECS